MVLMLNDYLSDDINDGIVNVQEGLGTLDTLGAGFSDGSGNGGEGEDEGEEEVRREEGEEGVKEVNGEGVEDEVAGEGEEEEAVAEEGEGDETVDGEGEGDVEEEEENEASDIAPITVSEWKVNRADYLRRLENEVKSGWAARLNCKESLDMAMKLEENAIEANKRAILNYQTAKEAVENYEKMIVSTERLMANTGIQRKETNLDLAEADARVKAQEKTVALVRESHRQQDEIMMRLSTDSE
jgi:hypothetical protein